ncbi:MAG: cobalamin-binding protein [Thermomicrobiaceae bacterium]|nr:cobalamin-binding protein [Thermomicrobiaceae bacterium]
MRIVSLLPSVTEICFALGLGDQLCAVTHECDYPPAARSKPHATRSVLPPGITDSAEIDRRITERVLSGESIYELDVPLLQRLAPDLILTQELCEVCAVSYEDVLRVARRLPGPPRVVSIEPRSVGEVLASIRTVGALTGREAVADAVVRALEHRIQAIRERIPPRAARPRVVCLEWLDPPMVGGHWVPEMVALAGGADALGRAGEPSRRVSWQEVLDAEPEVLVLMPCGYGLEQTIAESARLHDRPGLDALPAVRRGHVYAVDGSSYFNRPGPRLVGGIEILAGVLFPEAFARIGPPGAARAISLAAGEVAR